MRYLATLAVAVAALFIASGSAAAKGIPAHGTPAQPMCAIDDSGNCVGSCAIDDYNCQFSTGTDEFGADTWDGGYDLYTVGGGRCAYAAAHRSRHAPLGKLWTMFMQVYYCWNGSRVTQFQPTGPWGKDELAGSFAGNFYSTNWSTTTPPQIVNPGSYASIFTQMQFQTCFIAHTFLTCAPALHPWIQIVVDNVGHAICYSDSDYIGNCKGVRYR